MTSFDTRSSVPTNSLGTSAKTAEYCTVGFAISNCSRKQGSITYVTPPGVPASSRLIVHKEDWMEVVLNTAGGAPLSRTMLSGTKVHAGMETVCVKTSS